MKCHRSLSALPDRGRARWLAALWVILALGFWAQAVPAAEPDSPQSLSRRVAGDFASGRFPEAVKRWSAAAAAYAESGDSRGRIEALLGEGNAYLALGRYADAIAALEDAHARAKEVDDPELFAVTSASLGNGYLLSGRVDQAGILLGAAITDARASGRWDIAARAGNDQGSRLASIGRLDIAMQTYQDAVRDAERADDRLTVAKTRVNLARALQDAGRPEKAREELFQALSELVTLPHSHEQAFALVSAGRLFAAGVNGQAASQADTLLANQAFEAAAGALVHVLPPAHGARLRLRCSG